MTNRERDCMRLLAQGCSMKEIASVLGISRRTVEYYFDNIKNKLDGVNISDLRKVAGELQTLELL